VPTIISLKPPLVNSQLDSAVLCQKGPKTRKKADAKLPEVYKELNVLFFGTPEFSVPILETLCQSDFKPKTVITAPDRPAGRGQEITSPPIKIIAQKYEIKIFQPETKQELTEQALKIKPDLIVTAAYGKILSKEILDIPKYGSINVHPSLLPKYRGPSPIQFAILNGDNETGTTIMLMNEKMDEGPILAQQFVKIGKDDTAQILEQKLSKISAKLLIKTLAQWIMLKESPKSIQHLIFPQQQNNAKATYTKILTKQDGKIIWDKSAEELARQIRAFYPWPGSFSIFKSANGKSGSLKILNAAASKIQTEKELGRIFLTDDKKLVVQTGSGCLIINELQLEGSRPMNASDFLNGHPEIVEGVLQ